MLATLVEPRNEEGYLYEIKWDGYRAVAFISPRGVDLLSRNNKSFNKKFYPVCEAVRDWPIHAVIDGEIVVLDSKGRPNFGSLQNWKNESDGELVYYVFDIMWLDGYDLTSLPLTHRRKILASCIPPKNKVIRLSEAFQTSALALLKEVSKLGMEGIMAKKEDSLYATGFRSHEWLKMKSGMRHEVVIGGYTQNEGTSKSFSALLVGVYKRGKLHYTGKVGTGFSDQTQKDMLKQMKPLIRQKSPFAEEVDYNKPSRFNPKPLHATVYWLKPELVGEVAYTEMTSDGVMRHPAFKGLRNDKEAIQVREEKVWKRTKRGNSKS